MRNANQRVIVLAGPNGAGKSTLAPLLLRDRFGLMDYVNADTVALGLSAFDPEQVALQAGRIMLKRVHELARQRVSFAFESTLAGRSYAVWIKRLIHQGYDFHILYLWLRSPEIAVQRVKERVRMGGHRVPESTVRRRYTAGMRNFFELYRPLAKTWGVYDNSGSGEPVMIAAGSGSSTSAVYEPDLWSNFNEAAGWP